MGREVRMVPANWEHPKDYNGRYIPMYYYGYDDESAEFMKKANNDGLQAALDYYGSAPNKEEYMPEWTDEERTHYMMYEDTINGTPISPAFETPEELARWLADTGASAFGGQTASYESWLRVAKGGSAPSAVIVGGVLKNGVEVA